MRVVLFGATGTIGRATAKALLGDGHTVICPVRSRAGFRGQLTTDHIHALLPGTELYVGDISAIFSEPSEALQQGPVDAVVSCLASRTGVPADAWAVDYRMHADILKAAQASGVKQFVLLSAICVQKPLLAFQQAKLAFEAALIQSGIRYSIVRPTAFFKSLSGQIQRVQQGQPYWLFGDGRLTACKPISDQDLARFIASCLSDVQKHNQILPIGGPGAAITPIEQGDYLFQQIGRKPHFRHVPIALLDTIIHALSAGGYLVPALRKKAELAKIGRYYATESMLVWNPTSRKYDADATPAFGSQTLFDHYDALLARKERTELGDHSIF